jgi:hypothetical protein
VEILQANPGKKAALEELMSSAERELGAFIKSVTELFGSGQARLAAEEWIDELNSMSLPELGPQAWRAVTIASSVRLASRLNAARPR